jgi:hypothetical protein
MATASSTPSPKPARRVWTPIARRQPRSWKPCRALGGRIADVREAFTGVDSPDPQAADELHQARHALKHALMRKRGCAPDEARRIAGILDRATADILGRKD